MNRHASFTFTLCGLGLLLASRIMGQSTDGGTVVDGLPNNALTTEEARDGYELLWNGKDFTGWLVNNDKANPGTPESGGNWAIVTTKGLESNDTHKSANPDSNMLEVVKAGSSMFTRDKTYMNWDYKVEWQAVKNASGNSGLLYKFDITVSTDNNYSAPEYQLCNSEFTQEWKSLLTTAGCDYDMLPLLPSRKNPDLSPSWVRAEGHWNQSRIISYGARTAHFGNGLRLMEYEMLSPTWNTAYNRPSKYQGKGIYGKVHAGSFFLQDHGQKWMKFRNVRVKRLTESPWGPTSPYLNKEAAAKGDSSLVDNLTFATNLFPKGPDPVLPRYAIAPNKVATKVTAGRDGLSILFSEPGDYSLSIEDVHGVRFSVHRVNHANQFFLPGQFSHSPRILTIYKGDKKIQESIVGLQ
jgi:hypothetical protein